MKAPKSTEPQNVRLTLDVGSSPHETPLVDGAIKLTAEQVIATAKRHGIALHTDNDIVQALCAMPIPNHLPHTAFVLISEVLGFINMLEDHTDPE